MAQPQRSSNRVRTRASGASLATRTPQQGGQGAAAPGGFDFMDAVPSPVIGGPQSVVSDSHYRSILLAIFPSVDTRSTGNII